VSRFPIRARTLGTGGRVERVPFERGLRKVSKLRRGVKTGCTLAARQELHTRSVALVHSKLSGIFSVGLHQMLLVCFWSARALFLRGLGHRIWR